MLNALEQKLLQSLAENYPDWWASKHIVNIGKRLVQHRADYRFDKRLILTKHPTIIDRIRAGYASARFMTLQGNTYLVEATTDALFINCYFLSKNDAIAFATAIHYPRYLVALLKRTWQEVFSLVFHQTDHGTSTYLLMAITLEVFFHEQLGEWIQTENVVLSDEELSQV
ncbi:MAG: hypothetical protein CVV47_13615 [Spirochaetae bacterium HGW-Spirochaetae-3]|jgi:hypothetical protein|nr:MAG: hypothetical protein CVV47_13615 [Spirochaetae bacterium HGW-Spirochaetae-3]